MNRRHFLGMAALAAGSATVPTGAFASSAFDLAELRGSLNAADFGLADGSSDDQSRALQRAIDAASLTNRPIFLPPGNYHVSNINLAQNTRITGVPGATRLVFSGNGHFLVAENAQHVELNGLVIDGANRMLPENAGATLRISRTEHVAIDNCHFLGSTAIGVQVDGSAGRIERCSVFGARGECAIYGLQNKGLSIQDNEVSACSNGGILVHRYEAGEDGTIVTGNRIFNIGAQNGGTGQWGNGINVFRADSVLIANNRISDCAFSAIRSNAGGNVQITSNNCLRSGETAIYSEFEFQGAIISGNVVDGGAQGISITNFMQGGRLATCTGNLVRNIRAVAPYVDKDHFFGVGISVEGDTTVNGNVIENCDTFGMLLGWGPYLRDVAVSSNVIRKAATGIYVSVVEGCENTVIADNIISDTVHGAIVGYRWHEAVTGDLSVEGTSGYPHLAIERNRTS
ncbi:MAG: TIGR03808 family TAT-translocated repetitive protein [Rhizobiaceae bacterium]